MYRKLFIVIGISIISFGFSPRLFAAVRVPNDKYYGEQRPYLEEVMLPEAWTITTGSEDVIIAVIDSGVDMDHPDIISNMWFNRGERALNGVDDDGNGYVDDLNGWDFVDNSSDPHPKIGDTYNFLGVTHGTTVAGIAAEVTDNYEGLSGVCWKCKIMGMRVLDDTGAGTTDNVVRAINYAIANGADIINMSFVGAQTSDELDAAIKRAHDAGVLVVAAVGNDADDTLSEGGDLAVHRTYPVCSDGTEGNNYTIGVGSVDANGRKSSFSNFGNQCLDILAPGEGIAAPQLYDQNHGEELAQKYRTNWSGTSVAAPVVSGIAGLVKSVNAKLSITQIADILTSTAKNIDALNPSFAGKLGAGVVDAFAAVTKALETVGAGSGSRPSLISSRTVLVAPFGSRKADARIMDEDGSVAGAWAAYPDFFSGGAELTRGDVDGDGQLEIIAGAGKGGGPQVRVFSADGAVKSQFFAYDKTFRGGVHVASGDVNGDGVADIITAAGDGLSGLIKAFSYQGELLLSFEVSAPGLTDGVTVAASDLDGDGLTEIITGTGGGSLPLVGIFDILGKNLQQWLAYPRAFKGGVNVAVGDIDGDGQMEIVTAAGVGGGPQVRVFDAAGNAKAQFFAFEDAFRGGATVAVGNMDDDPAAEVLVGSGPGREPEVRIFSKFGASFSQDSMFTVYEKDFRGGVHVGY